MVRALSVWPSLFHKKASHDFNHHDDDNDSTSNSEDDASVASHNGSDEESLSSNDACRVLLQELQRRILDSWQQQQTLKRAMSQKLALYQSKTSRNDTTKKGRQELETLHMEHCQALANLTHQRTQWMAIYTQIICSPPSDQSSPFFLTLLDRYYHEMNHIERNNDKLDGLEQPYRQRQKALEELLALD
eukprot:scaffold5357_cov208-Amphora_coffeaeformis.AAC.2